MKTKHLLLTISHCLLATLAFAQTPTTTKNYVMETVVKHQGHKTVSSLSSLPVDSANRSIQYMDGLGRPVQTVQWQASPTKKDVVQHIEYDALGREVKKYLPYAEQGSSDGSYKTAAATNQASFYSAATGVAWDANIVKTSKPYAISIPEPSPLGRMVEQGAPGTVWQPYDAGISGSGHTTKMAYGLNETAEVKLWAVTGTGATSSGAYAANTLYKTVSRDENWTSGKTGTVEEFKDMEGHVVLKRLWETESVSLSTYYIYDDGGNLSYVVPPAVTANSFTETGDANFTNYIYGYHYDGKHRLTEKKVPGRGWEYMVYNRLDQVVLSQDANQRSLGRWLFSKYDAMGRNIITGLYTSASNRATLQAALDAGTVLWETRDNANANGTGSGYTCLAFPQTGISEYHIISYFDDYSFYNNSFTPGITVSTKTKGLSTGTRVNILGTTTMLLNVSYYDEDGRAILGKSQNHKDGKDIVASTYNFSGELTASTRTHTTDETSTVKTAIIANAFVYDHMGRKISTRENINSQGEVTLNRLVYNEIGQLKEKQLHSTNGTTFLQTTKLSYNERGWMKGSKSAEFSMKLGYDTTANAQYNGNISTQEWGSSYANKFLYTYDRLNRLVNGTSTGIITMGEVLTYDAMGNISTLSRDGGTAGTYNYTGNQLTSISTGPLATGSYAYDANGNATTDGRTGVTLTYNYLNLPQTASKTGLGLTYTYDASGQKLRKVNSTTSTTTDYIDGIQYTNGAIDFIQTETGLARRNGTTGSYSYEYNLTDHLGNVRYTFNEHPTLHTIQKLQEDDYYAFGLRKLASPGTNNYLYNGKELQDELGQYDYGARFYDPVVGRWNSVDPLAEVGRRWSPYVYAFNDPIRFTDPDGMWPDWFDNAVKQVKSGYNRTVAATKSAYNKTTATVKETGQAVQKWTTKNKETLLNTAKGMQEMGDKAALTGSVLAIAGTPVAGVGAAPGLALATSGGILSALGTGLEVTVDLITGNNKDAGITAGNEILYKGLEKLGTRAIDDIVPGASATAKVIAEQINSLVTTAVKSQTDKVVDKYKDKK